MIQTSKCLSKDSHFFPRSSLIYTVLGGGIFVLDSFWPFSVSSYMGGGIFVLDSFWPFSGYFQFPAIYRNIPYNSESGRALRFVKSFCTFINVFLSFKLYPQMFVFLSVYGRSLTFAMRMKYLLCYLNKVYSAAYASLGPPTACTLHYAL